MAAPFLVALFFIIPAIAHPLPSSPLYLQTQNNGIFQSLTTPDFALILVNSTPGDGFIFGIALNWKSMATGAHKIIWQAVLRRPVFLKPSLVFNSDGNLLLQGKDGSLLWSSGTANSGVTGLELLENGNLVLKSGDGGGIAWQSFDHPTDTLVEGQVLKYDKQLVKAASNRVGMYRLYVEASGLVLYYSIDQDSQPYWIHSFYDGVDNLSILGHACNTTVYAMLDPKSKQLVLRFSGDSAPFYTLFLDVCSMNPSKSLSLGSVSSSSGRALLQIDAETGNLHAYSLNQGKWTKFDFINDSCSLPDHCTICSDGKCNGCIATDRDLYAFQDQCANPLSCTLEYEASVYEMKAFPGIDYFSEYPMKNSHRPASRIHTEDGCQDACLQDCNCAVAFYWRETESCLHVDAEMAFFLKETSNLDHIAYVRVQSSSSGSNPSIPYTPSPSIPSTPSIPTTPSNPAPESNPSAPPPPAEPSPPAAPSKSSKSMAKKYTATIAVGSIVAALGAIVLYRIARQKIRDYIAHKT